MDKTGSFVVGIFLGLAVGAVLVAMLAGLLLGPVTISVETSVQTETFMGPTATVTETWTPTWIGGTPRATTTTYYLTITRFDTLTHTEAIHRTTVTWTETVTETVGETRTTATGVRILPTPPGTLGAVQVGDLVIVFNYTWRTKKVAYSEASEGHVFLAMNVTTENVGKKETYRAFPFSFIYYAELEVQGGNLYSSRSTYVSWPLTVRPGEKGYDIIYWEIPEDAVPTSFIMYYGVERQVICTIELGG